MRVLVLLDAAGCSPVRWTGAAAVDAGRRRRLPQPPGARRGTEGARAGDGRGVLRRRTAVRVAAAAAAAALAAPRSRSDRCSVVIVATVALVTVAMATGRRRSWRRIRGGVRGRRVAAAAVVAAAVAGAVAMTTVVRAEIQCVVDLADETFR